MLISRYFGIGSVTSYFLLLKFSLLDVKMRKKKSIKVIYHLKLKLKNIVNFC